MIGWARRRREAREREESERKCKPAAAEPSPERDHLRAESAAVPAMPDWEKELFKYIWVTDGQLLYNPEKIADVIERIGNEGIESVLYIRCMRHRGGPQYNKDEHGQECTECAVQALRAEVERLKERLVKDKARADKLILLLRSVLPR